jgi:D-alanyl-D-alanine carboxypeptidase
MKSHVQFFLLICLLIVSVIVSNFLFKKNETIGKDIEKEGNVVVENIKQKKYPTRDWNVSDPVIDAEGAMIYSLDSNFSYLNYQTYKQWPIASITKLLTTIVFIEDIGIHKKVPITKTALETEGISGEFKSGEVYSGQDFVTIMLLASSNDAATAIEEVAGGREKFVSLLNAKVKAIGMNDTYLEDASGLSPKNVSTPNDLIKLARYIAEKHPEILSWTRLQSFFAQSTNSSESRVIYNVNPFSKDFSFLGGKTGTSPEARENVLGFFTFRGERVICVILGSYDRVSTKEKLFNWVQSAYPQEIKIIH